MVIYLSVALLLMLFEEKLIFPAPNYDAGEDLRPNTAFEDVFFQSADGTSLHGWYFPAQHARGHLLYCHGNADQVAYLGEFADMLRQRYGLSVFVFDYRGYGQSDGKPTEFGVMLDARAAQAWLVERGGIARDDTILMGRSLGGGVAVALAAEGRAKALVLQNTFTSLPDVAAHHYPWIPVHLLMRTRFNSIDKVNLIDVPVLQSHAARDEIIPFRLGRRLHDSMGGNKEFFVCHDIGHNDPEPVEYYKVLGEFLSRLE